MPQSYKRIGSTKSAFTSKAASSGNIGSDTEPTSPLEAASRPQDYPVIDEFGLAQTNDTVHQYVPTLAFKCSSFSQADVGWAPVVELGNALLFQWHPPISCPKSPLVTTKDFSRS